MMKKRVLNLLLIICLLFFFISCGSDDKSQVADEENIDTELIDEDIIEEDLLTEQEQADILFDEKFFEENAVHQIEIDINPSRWDNIRFKRRSIMDIFGEENCEKPMEDVYDYYPADVTIDGEKLEWIGIRKKGFVGSQSSAKPSLKLKFSEYDKDLRFHGIERITLNNNRQDPSNMKQCMSYYLMAKAGVAAPRCNYAIVSVNGKRLGIYTVLEAIKKPFLKRHFNDDSGNMYEGTIADFRDEESWKVRLDKKTNEKENDRSDIERLTNALIESDDNLEKLVEKELDIDAFITYWAMELLIGHWDGYATNNNNFIVYRNPENDKFYFIPWGVDGTFQQQQGREERPFIQFVGSMITRRFYYHPELKKVYKKRVEDLLDSILNLDSTLEKFEEIKKILYPFVEEGEKESFDEAYSDIKLFLYLLDSQLREELNEELPSFDDPLKGPMCFRKQGELHSTLETTWGSHPAPNVFLSGSGTFDMTIQGNEIGSDNVGASAGTPDESGREEETQILGFAEIENGDIFIVYSVIPNREIFSGNILDLATTESFLLILPKGAESASMYTYLQSGTLNFIEAEVKNGANLKVEYSADILFP